MTYGEVLYKPGCWVIRTEPHVRARLKRVFARAPQEAANEIVISDTPENARDLSWFLQRYPMEVRDPERLSLQMQRHVEMERGWSDLLAARAPLQDITLAKPARDYQRIAAQGLAIRGGLLLADDVGIGKTVSAICSMIEPDNLPVLVVCETNLPEQWHGALNEFAPQLRAHIIRGGTPYDLSAKVGSRRRDMWSTPPDVLITNYHKLRGWAEALAGKVRYVVFDEVQRLRHPTSDIYKAARHVSARAKLKIGLSATPIYNYGSEFFWVVDVLLPGCLGTREEFVREWCTGYGDKAMINDTELFGAYLRREGIMLRRTRQEVGRELPPLTKIVHTVETDKAVLDRLTGNAMELARIIVSRSESFRGEQMKAAGEFDALMRQATGIAKAPYVAEFVRLIVENGEKVILYGWHHQVYAIWMERLADLKPVLYSGLQSAAQKREAKENFMKGDSSVLVMSLRSAAGLDGLQHVCRTSVFGELDWSPGVHEQCIGRPFRDGQPDPVSAYFLVAEDGADPIMAEVLGIKREQIEGVRNPGAPRAEKLESAEKQIRKLAMQLLASRGATIQ
jgi:SNF2 family DNA or RNA helicase